MKEYIVSYKTEEVENSTFFYGGNVEQELIRCKDCKFYWSENHVCTEIGADDGVYHVHVGDDDYCSMAERKEE